MSADTLALLPRALAALALAAAVGWGALALWLDGPGGAPRRALLAGAWLLAVAAVVAALPFWPAAGAVLLLLGAVLAWWLRLAPRNDRDWSPEVARLPTGLVEGGLLTLHNVRAFDYRSEQDYQPRWETRRYALEEVTGLDLFQSFWGPTLYAHSIASWEFADGRHLAVSVETRKRRGQGYSALKGFFRQYEVCYVAADERDLIGLRARHRGERVWLYRLRMAPSAARALLVDYVSEMNRLSAHPRWYNALTFNCTTAMRHHRKRVYHAEPWNWRVLASGHLDELLYRHGDIHTGLPLAELRRRSEVTEVACAAADAPDFSGRIRLGLPPRPASG